MALSQITFSLVSFSEQVCKNCFLGLVHSHDLKLDDVVTLLFTNRTYLLNAIKSELGISFSEYVNRKRIDHAMRLQKNDPDILRQELAIRSGYNSVSSFYRNLKKYGK